MLRTDLNLEEMQRNFNWCDSEGPHFRVFKGKQDVNRHKREGQVVNDQCLWMPSTERGMRREAGAPDRVPNQGHLELCSCLFRLSFIFL